ncbi:hypothetical protein Hanom_Chr11g01000331 [Helianthus anomalus]
MDSKTGESSSSAQAGFDALYVKWGLVSFNNLVQEYDIRAEWNPILPSKTDTTFPLKEGKITLFSDFFKFYNFRLPITKFCKSVLDHYPIHISQLHPLGLVKLRHFEFACVALSHIPELTVFRAFFILAWKSPFFTFDRRDIGVSCLRDIPSSSRDKHWNKKFLYVNASVIPGGMQWREMGAKDKFKDEGPPADAYIENALFKKLSQHPSECTVIPEGVLVMAGMSLLWQDIRLYPSFYRDYGGEWSMFDFVDPPRSAALRAADRVLGEQEPDGSSSGFVDDGARLGNDLNLPTICWDPKDEDQCHQPKWKIAESSRLIFPPVVHHRIEQACPSAESAYVEGLNNENLMNVAMVDAVSQPRRLAEI